MAQLRELLINRLGRIGLLSGVFGLLFLAEYVVIPTSSTRSPVAVLIFAYLMLAIFAVELHRRRTKSGSDYQLYLFGALTIIHSLGLAILWSVDPIVWLGLAGVSVLAIMWVKLELLEQNRLMFAMLPFGSAVIGILFSQNPNPVWSNAIMGLGVLAVGGVMGLLRTEEGGHHESAVFTQEQETLPKTATQPFLPVSTAENFEEIALRLHVTVDGLVRAAEAINESTQQQSTSAEEQQQVISVTNSTLDDFLHLSQRISVEARNVTETAQTATENSQQGHQAITEAIKGMEELRQQVTAIGETIVTLAKLTQRIDEIITSVSEIATQSNLLALNASIEAARAGVHGRGFAVVADEVRNLAQQSTQSAEQVQAILAEIQRAMKETVRATQVGMEGVTAGVERTQEANDVMVQLSESVAEANTAVRDIYTIIMQQAQGLEEISIGMDRIGVITQTSIANTRAVEAVSVNLSRLAADLQETVGGASGLEGIGD